MVLKQVLAIGAAALILVNCAELDNKPETKTAEPMATVTTVEAVAVVATTDGTDATKAVKDSGAFSRFNNPKHRECLAKAMYFEARGTGETGMRAVGEVVLNRVASGKFPNTICDVLNQRYNGACQFSFMCSGRHNIYAELRQKNIADRIALVLLTERGADITKGALFFHSARISPGWFATLSPRGKFGNQLFYR